MYEQFDDEKRAMFRDMESYNIITELWSAFNDYLRAARKGIRDYGTIRLHNGYYIKGYRYTDNDSMNNWSWREGLVLYIRPTRFKFKRKIVSIDKAKRSDQILIYGVDIKSIDRLSKVIELLKIDTKKAVEVEKERRVDLTNRLEGK